MLRRIRTLLAAYLAGRSDGARLPVATLFLHGFLVAVFCLLLQGSTTPFAYALCALSLSGALLAIPLSGEFGYLLRADPSEEWIAALPISKTEIRVARSMHLLCVLFTLALGSLLPAAFLFELGPAASLGLVLAGLAQASLLAAVLLGLQTLFGGRAEVLFLMLQTLLVIGVTAGLVLGLQHVSVIADLTGIPSGSPLAWLPTAHFAACFGEQGNLLPPVLIGLLSVATVLLTPRPSGGGNRGRMPLEVILAPIRKLATRFWVQRNERAIFDFVYDALPREREVILRSYPMFGIPLAFLLAAYSGEPGSERQGLLALILFTPGIYLPVLLTQVPASESHQARWLLDCSPMHQSVANSAAIKALAVRFLLPLYAALTLIAWQGAGIEFALRLAPIAALTSLLVMRMQYTECVSDPPLSTPPESISVQLDGSGSMFVLTVGLTVLAVVANATLTSLGSAGFVLVALLAIEIWAERGSRVSRA